jgi:DNA-binding transcriptional LysR family regulator
LLATIAPRFEEIQSELMALNALRDTPAGIVRITCSEHAAENVLWPKLAPVLRQYPDIKLELYVDHSFTDIVAERFDAGVRLGESLEKDMIAIPIAPDGRLIAVAAPDYFNRHGRPSTPQDLVRHACINVRLSMQGGLYPWEFEKDGRSLRVRVNGQLTFNTARPRIAAALEGFGIAFVPEDSVQRELQEGRLVQVLNDWCQQFSGFHLYYPSRRQTSLAFRVVADALRYRGG